MRKVQNGRCIANISKKSILANKKRNSILLAAIILTTVMLSTLFTVASSLLKSLETATCYQVGTYTHAGFKYLTQEEYDKLKTDTKIYELSYNIILGEVLNDELSEDYTEVRYTEPLCAKQSYSYPETGTLPQKYEEVATCTAVLDAFGIPHELGQTLHLQLTNGFDTYEGDFKVCGIWEKPALTLTNEIYFSKEFQESFAPAWKDREDYNRHLSANSYAGSINPDFNFSSSFNITGKMEALKERLGFGDEIKDGINWAYTTSELDATTVLIVAVILIMIILAGYLIIYNIFLIAITSDIHYYGLLKTIGMTNRQLKKMVLRQALFLSVIAIPVGMLLGYLISYFVVPLIANNMLTDACKVYPNGFVFLACAVFAWITVRISCAKPCRIIRKISPVEAVKFSDCPVEKLSKHRKAKWVTPFSMAWENLKRNKKRTTAVLLSMVLSVLMINVTVSIVSCFDEDKYISMFAGSDFSIADATLYNLSAIDQNLEGVSAQDMEALREMDGVTESGAIYMEESEQKLEGDAWERMKKIYEEHTDWYVQSPDEKEWWDSCVYDRQEISAHLYGVDELIFHALELETDKVDWNTFCSGDYAIVSSMLDSDGNDADLALYQVGEKIPVQLPDGSTKEYEVIGIGDVPYVMGPMHSHGMDIYITIPAAEYLKVVPQAKGALQFMINVEKEYLEADEAYVEQYCDVTNQKLDFKSRKMYLQEFKDMVNMFLIVGGALSAILALIGILNFINLTYTSIHERKQELKILWSVGMTKKQIASMLSFEGMLRMGLAFVLVLTVGQLLNYYVVYAIAGGMIMFTSHYVIWPMLVCIPVFGVIAALIPRSMVKKIF